MKKLQKSFSIVFLILSLLYAVTPFAAQAQLSNIIPCGNSQRVVDTEKLEQRINEQIASHPTQDPNVIRNGYTSDPPYKSVAVECTFGHFVQLIKNLVNILFTISIPITVIAFTYIGILLLTAGGNTAKVTQAKEIAGKVLMGFLIILSAWLLVYTITSTFLNPEFNIFLKQ